ncbi:MAG: hypothetical protein JWR21_2738 [Herminiimonas sp.]|nr:hypothetical protein [Herminiimonas sp.]
MGYPPYALICCVPATPGRFCRRSMHVGTSTLRSKKFHLSHDATPSKPILHCEKRPFDFQATQHADALVCFETYSYQHSAQRAHPVPRN